MSIQAAMRLSKYKNAQQYTGDPNDPSARAKIRSQLNREFQSAQPKPGFKARQSPKTNFANGLLADSGFSFQSGEVPSIRDVSNSQITRMMELANGRFDALKNSYAQGQEAAQQNYLEMGSLGLLPPESQQEYNASTRAPAAAAPVFQQQAAQGIASFMRPSLNVVPYSSQTRPPVVDTQQYSPFYNAMDSYNEDLYSSNPQLQDYADPNTTPFAFDYSGYYSTGGKR